MHELFFNLCIRRESVFLLKDILRNPVFRMKIFQSATKSTSGHQYALEGGPGLLGDTRVDPALALDMYVRKRSETSGFVLVNFKEVAREAYEMDPVAPWMDSAFLSDIRDASD